MGSRFKDLSPPLSKNVLKVVSSLGFTSMTPVQAAVIPLFLGNKDVAAEACTGSGKTLAFVIPIIERLQALEKKLAKTQVGAIVISPTRELARQTFGVIKKFTGVMTDLHPILLVGGSDTTADMFKCAENGCNIMIATPGRLLDVLNRASVSEDLSFKSLEVLVLDEADTLLDMGFSDTITDILTKLPKQRRTGLFSATQTREVASLTRAGLRNPAVVSVKVQYDAPAADTSSHIEGSEFDETHAIAKAGVGSKSQSTPSSLKNYYVICPDSEGKFAELVVFLRERAASKQKAIVFVLTCASVDFYGRIFSSGTIRKAAGLPSAELFPILPLHGQMAPKKRIVNFSTYSDAPAGVLLCTDVAARGIDVPDVDWILQYDPPKDPAFFVHRVGRTARAGRKGSALLFLLPKESGYVPLLGVKNVPIVETAIKYGSDADFSAEKLRELLMGMRYEAVDDRDVLEKGTKAFISFMRGYSEHICRYIFKLKNIDVPTLASSFGLVKLPKVDELRGQDVPYEGLPDVDTHSIKFKDPAREVQRQARLVAEAAQQAAARAARDARREKALTKPDVAEKRKRTHKGVQKRIFEDWDLLAREERLEKRLKLGKISKDEYKREMAKLNRELGIGDDDGMMDFAVEHEVGSDTDDARPAKKARLEMESEADDASPLDDGGEGCDGSGSD